MAISHKTAKIIRRRLFSAHGVPRIQTPRTQLPAAKQRALRSLPKLPKRVPKLAPLPKVR